MPTFNAAIGSIDSCEPTYSSITLLTTEEGDNTLNEFLDDADPFIDDDELNLNSETNKNADNHRLCRTKVAHDDVVGKIDASLAKETLTALEAPHSDTTALSTSLDPVSKTIDFDFATILPEQRKDRVLGTIMASQKKIF